MRKIKSLSVLVFYLFVFPGYSQTKPQKCAFPQVINMLDDRGFSAANTFSQMLQQFRASELRNNNDTFYYVRVVVHVVYNTPEENLPDSVIHNQIAVLNEDYSRSNADTVNMRQVFSPVTGQDTKIRFILADTDPQGNPSNGITRTSTTQTSFFDLLGGGLAEGVKSTAGGGIDPWDQTRYLNIWVCDMSIPFLGPAVLGYATPPAGLPNWDAGSTAGLGDGVVIQYQVFGSNNPNTLDVGGTNYVVKGRTVVHEVGHYLGLRHIWGDATNCTGNDGMLDTPRANDASAQDCDITKNTCVDTIAGIDLPDMIENYMDYSAEDCQNSFTNEQAQFMHWVIQHYRNDIATIAFTGLNDSGLSKNSLLITPNPATAFIQTKTNFQYTNYQITNIHGQWVADGINGKSINVQALQSGVYFLHVWNAQKSAVAKFIKQ